MCIYYSSTVVPAYLSIVVPPFTVPPFTARASIYRALFLSPKSEVYSTVESISAPFYHAHPFTVHFSFTPRSLVNGGTTVFLSRILSKYYDLYIPCIFASPNMHSK